MSTQTPPACADGIRAATLSAWRDDRLSPARASRLVVHLAQCAACQARLAAYDALAQRLRAQTVPGPDARLRRTLRARIARFERTAAQRWPRPLLLAPQVRRLLGAVGAIAAALLLVAGFARLLGATRFCAPPASQPPPRRSTGTPPRCRPASAPPLPPARAWTSRPAMATPPMPVSCRHRPSAGSRCSGSAAIARRTGPR